MADAKENKKSNTGLIAGIIAGVVAVVAAIVIVIIIIANGGKSDLVGTWKFVSAKSGDTDVSSMMTLLGVTPTITFNSDGTGTTNMNGEESKFTYDKDKLEMKTDDETQKLKVDGKKLTIEGEGMSMEFEKQ